MHELWTIARSEETLLRLERALSQHWPPADGWLLVDTARATLPTLSVFRRPWLKDPGGMGRLRVDGDPVPLASLKIGSGLPVVLWTEEASRQEEADLRTLAGVLERDFPCLRLRLDGDDGYRVATPEGRWQPLPPVGRRPLNETLTVELEGARPAAYDSTLPLSVAVASQNSQETVRVRIKPTRALAQAEARFRLRSQNGGPLGKGGLTLDVELSAGGDRLVLTPQGFREPVEVSRLSTGTPRRRRRFPARSVVRLHLLFDRTTLDLEAWPRAMDALMAGERGVPRKQSFTKEEESSEADSAARAAPQHWNLEIRQQLARAVAAKLDKLHRKIDLDLWWFADQPRPGIDPPGGLPRAQAAFSRFGQCNPNGLEEALAGVAFDYATGLDLYDAADELLAKITEEIEHGDPRAHHAVLIAGDSPPPPNGREDPIWRQLVDTTPRTNARCSALFQDSLKTLSRRGVPVGWLFLRHVRTPMASGRLADLLRHYPVFQNLREEALSALRRHTHLVVQAAEGIETLDTALETLLGLMAVEIPAKSELEIGGIA